MSMNETLWDIVSRYNAMRNEVINDSKDAVFKDNPAITDAMKALGRNIADMLLIVVSEMDKE